MVVNWLSTSVSCEVSDELSFGLTLGLCLHRVVSGEEGRWGAGLGGV